MSHCHWRTHIRGFYSFLHKLIKAATGKRWEQRCSREIIELLESLGHNPIEATVRMATDGSQP
jgi:hypothetical protein